MSEKQGWIKLHRKIQDSALWREKRKFSKLEAWIDILLEVQHSPEPQQIILRGQVLICNRGESVKSMDTWSLRWGWSKSSTRRFLHMLQTMDQIRIKNELQTTRLTVCNFDLYNAPRTKDEPRMNQARTEDEPSADPDKKDKNEENEKKKEKNKEKTPPYPLKGEIFALSEFLQLSESKKAIAENWIAYKNERNEKYKLTGLKTMFNKIGRMTESEAAESIESAIANNYKGFFIPKETGKSKPSNYYSEPGRDWGF